MPIDITAQVDTSALADGQAADASDVKNPIDDLVGVINNALNGAQEFEVLRGVLVSDPAAHATHWKMYFKSTGLFVRQSTADGGAVVGPLSPAGAVDASTVTYTPSVLADWTGSADPGDADNALDQLGARIKVIEGGGVPGGAPDNATFITQTPSAGLTSEQALSALATGILKNTTTTGVLSIATGSDLPTVPIGNGGTGQTAQTAAMDALAPTTTKGDLIVHNGTDNIRVAVGTNDHVLTADSAQASGVKWAAPAGGAGPQFVQGTSVTVGNSTTEATLLNVGAGSATIAAAALTQYKSIRITGMGLAQRTGGNFILRFKLGGTTIIATANAAQPIGSGANNPFKFDLLLTCLTTGASGTIIGQGIVTWGNSTITINGAPWPMTAAATIDTTGTLLMDLTAQWSSVAATNTITLTNLLIELV